MAAFAADELHVEVDGAVEQVFGQVASGNYFELLGVRPAAGRVMTLADETLDPAVAVIGYGYAQRRFGRAPRRIGRTIAFKDRAFTIVGVTPPEFWGLQPGRDVDVTLPITQDRTAIARSRRVVVRRRSRAAAIGQDESKRRRPRRTRSSSRS